MILCIALLVGSLALLVLSCNMFVEKAEKVGIRIGISPFIIGALFVAVGTSLPELVSSIIAVHEGEPDIVIGNVLGSNIINLLLLVSLSAFVAGKVTFSHDLMRIDIPYLLGSTMLIALMMLDGKFSRGEAVISLLCLGCYMYSCSRSKGVPALQRARLSWIDMVLFAATPVAIFFGGKWTVDQIIVLSKLSHVGMEAVSFSVVAFGTSLPEIIVSLQAARKGKVDLILGNAVGGSIFKSFSVMGIPALIKPLPISQSIIHFCMPVSIAVSFLFVFVLLDRQVNRCEAAFMLLFYAFFILKLFQAV